MVGIGKVINDFGEVSFGNAEEERDQVRCGEFRSVVLAERLVHEPVDAVGGGFVADAEALEVLAGGGVEFSEGRHGSGN